MKTYNMKELLPKRPDDSHKGDFGKDLVIAGSKYMAGAAIFATKACYRAGAGLVYAMVPNEILPVVQNGCPEAVFLFKPDYEMIDRVNACLIGPGLVEGAADSGLVKNVLTRFRGPVIIDASALTIVAKNDYFSLLRARNKEGLATIITPHMGEAAKLLGYAPDAFTKPMSFEERADVARQLAQKTAATVLLKGHQTIVCELGQTIDEYYVNETGNSGMATAGSGDVLSGIILALLGQGVSARNAAILGAYIHGKAGDLAALDLGKDGLMASDLVNYTALAIKNLREE